jgi:hypothetical protein
MECYQGLRVSLTTVRRRYNSFLRIILRTLYCKLVDSYSSPFYVYGVLRSESGFAQRPPGLVGGN